MEAAKTQNRAPHYEERPWGSFKVLDEGNGYKVKRIEVLPGKRLSYQKHAQRAEHWMVVQGSAKVTLDGRELMVRLGETVDVPVGAAHRIENTGYERLIFIEIQRGNYLGEDDIVRLQDDFGRISEERTTPNQIRVFFRHDQCLSKAGLMSPAIDKLRGKKHIYFSLLFMGA